MRVLGGAKALASPSKWQRWLRTWNSGSDIPAPKTAFERRSGRHKIRCSSEWLNRLVLQYLIQEGLGDAAAEFCQEACLEQPAELGEVGRRAAVREAVQAGDIDRVINLVNDISPRILDEDKHLLFGLRSQQLLALIRARKTEDALLFSQTYLAPFISHGNGRNEFSDKIQDIMLLLIYEDPLMSPSSHLLDESVLVDLSDRLNTALLHHAGEASDSALISLLKFAEISNCDLRAPRLPVNGGMA